jgi:hypothetical protein
MYKPASVSWPLRPLRGKNGRRGQRGPTATPRRPDGREGRLSRGLLDRAPRDTGRSAANGEKAVSFDVRRLQQRTAAGKLEFTLGLAGAAEIRRCFPIPSPPPDSPPPLRRPGELEGVVLSPKLRAAVVKAAWTPRPHPSIPLTQPFLATAATTIRTPTDRSAEGQRLVNTINAGIPSQLTTTS